MYDEWTEAGRNSAGEKTEVVLMINDDLDHSVGQCLRREELLRVSGDLPVTQQIVIAASWAVGRSFSF